MRPGALSVGCMVGMFWDAEVRCCIVVKPFHLESSTLAKGLQFSLKSTQNEILSSLNSTSATGKFFQPICIPKTDKKTPQ